MGNLSVDHPDVEDPHWFDPQPDVGGRSRVRYTSRSCYRAFTHKQPYYQARMEYAWLLRSQGLTYRAIGHRLDCSVSRVGQLVKIYGGAMEYAMRHVSFAGVGGHK